MRDSICVIEVGTHPGPYWRDTESGLVVCDRHRQQYNERDELGTWQWEMFTPSASLPEATSET